MFTNKNSKELMHLMEQACGSVRFSEEYEKNEKRLHRIAKEKMEMNRDLRAIMKDRKKADQFVKDIEDSGKLMDRESKLETQMLSSRYLVLYLDAKVIKKKVKRLKVEIKKKKKEIERLSGIILKISPGGKIGKTILRKG
jgi:predicted transcriptional regulator